MVDMFDLWIMWLNISWKKKKKKLGSHKKNTSVHMEDYKWQRKNNKFMTDNQLQSAV